MFNPNVVHMPIILAPLGRGRNLRASSVMRGEFETGLGYMKRQSHTGNKMDMYDLIFLLTKQHFLSFFILYVSS